ncbi:hypothetical protein K493DRAFT_67393 [Basidiobolus meristosporus CBS 931.73]|uniref:ATP-dependent DNA helicase n=1 Tax=Basidiobolus meristosporus CBS 931.73 TaxID=1314790 RepID=A0A1Y1XUU2_9FUNG|nr:hypothetical protein K493DRAFT_67393 [Basidiobolus meristosporus CBS 931.73]|eukprot:ORX89532.1 hypothetical protein K493DRAFT_67393 [Basidiobolus meristosporus CBS 931.73]
MFLLPHRFRQPLWQLLSVTDRVLERRIHTGALLQQPVAKTKVSKPRVKRKASKAEVLAVEEPPLPKIEAPLEPVTLSVEQKNSIREALTGCNVFLTGSAGVGKSFLLRYLIEKLREEGKNVAVTAPTGIAAFHIGGHTVHHFAGLPVRNHGWETTLWNVGLYCSLDKA